jgi:hypothetical protein
MTSIPTKLGQSRRQYIASMGRLLSRVPQIPKRDVPRRMSDALVMAGDRVRDKLQLEAGYLLTRMS